jgi:MoaA/NifB/PqqE/SkfB family radical SAM enzyme
MMIDKNPWEYTDIFPDNKLRYLSIACTHFCNFNCTFCSKKYVAAKHLNPNFLSDTLEEAFDLGLTKVELTGGEPLLYPAFWDITALLARHDITILIVTNGSLIDAGTAERLAAIGSCVSISLSTLEEEKFNRLSGTNGAFDAVRKSVSHLQKAGFSPDKKPLMGIQSIATRDTFDEIDRLRQWAEDQGCMFILNRPIPLGGLSYDEMVSPGQLKLLLDAECEEGCEAAVPFSLDSPCNRLKAGCYLDASGLIHPCPAIDIVCGSLHERSLSDIWKNSEVLSLCRHIENHLEGACGTCGERYRCYGCRAVAWAATGRLTAADPGCFRVCAADRYKKDL